MKTMKILVCALSFAFLSACSSFDAIKDIDMAFTCTIPGGDIQLSGNPIEIVGTTTTTGKTMHRMLCRVTCTDGAIPGGPWTDSKPIDSGGATFDIHSIVDARFDYQLSVDDEIFITDHDLLAAAITVEIGESYIESNELVESWSGETEAISVLKGRLTDLEYAMMIENGETFISQYIAKGLFLSVYPAEIYLSPSSIQKLFFIPAEDGTYTVLSYIQFTDGSYTEKSYSRTFLTSEMTEFQMSVELLDDIDDAGKTPDYMELTIKNGTGEVVASRHVLFDNNFNENLNEFYFVNRLSGVDLVVCTGGVSDNIKSDGEIYSKGYQTVMQKGNRVIERGDFRRYFKCDTGFKTLQERRFLIEFLSSHTAWWKTELFGRPDSASFGLVPIIITPGSFEIDTTSDDLKSIEFEFEIATTR